LFVFSAVVSRVTRSVRVTKPEAREIERMLVQMTKQMLGAAQWHDDRALKQIASRMEEMGMVGRDVVNFVILMQQGLSVVHDKNMKNVVTNELVEECLNVLAERTALFASKETTTQAKQ
jgi:hypothetical protein